MSSIEMLAILLFGFTLFSFLVVIPVLKIVFCPYESRRYVAEKESVNLGHEEVKDTEENRHEEESKTNC